MSFQERKSGGLWKGLRQLKGSYRKLVVFLLFVDLKMPKAHLWECWKISGHGGGAGGGGTGPVLAGQAARDPTAP